jgi:hypothetical protein
MKQTQHTPELWEVCKKFPTLIYDKLGNFIADTKAIIQKAPTEQEKANAILIAAAPEMLEALEYATEALQALRKSGFKWRDTLNLDPPPTNNFKAVIAKAKGE